ncbi:MAG: hypothetical protein JW775_01220 [Candidatus Aminicenantes bacterium]|nr:hypothetical protein [Candidatus Aminicenantes bacterium]
MCIGTNDIERLRCAALEAFESTLARHLPNPEFGGQIVLVILSDMTLQSVEVWAATAALEDQLRGILDRHPLQTVTGQAVGVRIQYTSRQEP